MKKPGTIDQYIASAPKAAQPALKQVRTIIKSTVPGAEEVIWYSMPAFRAGKVVISFAGYARHIGIYPGAKAIVHFQKELTAFNTSKGAIQFPLSRPVPVALLKRIVKFNLREGAFTMGKSAARPHTGILAYNRALPRVEKALCDILASEFCAHLRGAENKIWHGHPVWFLDGNPVAGYSRLKDCIRLLFWSGQSFSEERLQPEGSFKAAEIRYTSAALVKKGELKRWLGKAARIQWDYKNIVKRKGGLLRLK
jgi:uncharacterized protein YdhG (YjbR/CyaY superfamily)